MSWMSRLYETYEKLEGQSTALGTEITPIAHMNANAQLEVSVSVTGEFLGAVSVDKSDAVTLVPVSETSAGRSSGVAPHALCDMLPYVAGDFEDYCREKNKRNGPKVKYEQYMDGLRKWAESAHSHPKVRAIYAYLSKKKLIADLIGAGLVELDEEHFLDNKKIAGQPYERVMVRFRVVSADFETEDAVWKDHTLIKAYTEYYLANQQGTEDICYFSGEKKTISKNHPKGIVAANYGAKLISANDDRGFTYRGRFQNADQPFALSYEASQKIHSALTWLAKNQGVYAGTKDRRMFLCWNPEGKKTPNIINEFDLIEDEPNVYEFAAYKRKIHRMLRGYQEMYEGNEPVIVMGLDAATTGRLSITYYNEFIASDFFERILYWGETCNWMYLKFNEKKQPYYNRETPIFKKIAECAFGREQESTFGHEKRHYIELDDKVLKVQTQRLMKCMLEKQPVPFDLVQALMIRSSTPLAYSRNNRERVLSTACALISKYHMEKEGKENAEEMRLNEENQDRSYLFGRILAVCEKVERSTYDKDETREPNAIRLQSVYVNHPLHTLQTLQGLLEPYFRKLPCGVRGYYRNMIGEIMQKFREEDEPKMNQGLEETYLLGYYLQRAELNKQKEKNEGGKENERASE